MERAKFRQLTEAELEQIYAALDASGEKGFPSRDKFLEVLNGYWNFDLLPALRKVKLTTAAAVGGVPPFELLKQGIVAKWKEARAEPGSSAGGLAAEALTQPVMQAVLKSFHFAGVKKSSFGSEAAVEIVGMSQNRRVPVARVFLLVDLPFSQTYDYHQRHRRLTVQDLLGADGYDIVPNPEGKAGGMPAWWRGARAGKVGKPPRMWRAGFVLRLSPAALHQYRVSPAEIAATIEEELNRESSRGFYCLGSPVAEAQVVVLVEERVLLSVPKETFGMQLKGGRGAAGDIQEHAFFAHVAKHRILECPLRGDRYLADGLVVAVRVLSVVAGERGNAEEGYVWTLNRAAFKDGVTPYKLGKLLARAGLRVTSVGTLRVSESGLEKDGIAYHSTPDWAAEPSAGAEPAWLDYLRGLVSWRGIVSLGVATTQHTRFPAAAGVVAVRAGRGPVRLVKAGEMTAKEFTPSVLSSRFEEAGFAVAGGPALGAGEPDSWEGVEVLELRPAAGKRPAAEAELSKLLAPFASGPLDALRRAVDGAESQLAKRDRTNKELEALPYVRPPDPADPLEVFSVLGVVWYLTTSQGDLRTLLTHPDVDPRFTVTNQFRANKAKTVEGITEILGVAALRNFVFEEFYELLTGGGDYTDPQHVALVADSMVNMGKPIPLTPVGFALRDVSTTDKAYQQKATNTYLMSAFKGISENVTTASAIHLGQPIPQGTGWVTSLVEGVSAPSPGLSAPGAGKVGREERQREAFSRAVDVFLGAGAGAGAGGATEGFAGQ